MAARFDFAQRVGITYYLTTTNSCSSLLYMDAKTLSVAVDWLGRIDYQAALILQETLVQERVAAPELEDRLLLLEHPPTYTLGRGGDMRHLLLNEAQLAERQIAFYRVGRGGDITYHGPGQLVGYPILNLKRLHSLRGLAQPDLHAYVSDIEQVLIHTLAHFGVAGWRYEGYTGVWVDTANGPCKIAAIGVRVSSKGISSHGFALNVATDLSYFTHIIPCGIKEHGVTSLTRMLQRPVAIAEVIAPLVEAFREVFHMEHVLENDTI
ncbi:octanoyltransferase [Candidatus Vecturithrix granuli]|uniref:Octanoyltransferase n=1 Tax=Vecturithrix granuli TaxID=1499967 RepID=A0A081BYP0_VECG1|nr:octanoyltransferase [Candidatus Vecturithrix granuli]